MQTLRSRIEAAIASRHLLNHSFYQRWQMGELTREELQGYAKEYYSFEKEFPCFLSAIHSKLLDQSMRQQVLENLIHEERGEDNHIELWLKFAEGLGVSRDEVKTHFRSDETEHLLRVFRKHAQSNPISGLAALHAYEQQQPSVAAQKSDGLKKFYGIEDDSTVAFFKAHEHYDVGHSGTEMSLLEQLCDNELKQEMAVQATNETVQALYEFLDGVERRYRQAA